ncbi:serum response factor-binding protein 1 [Ditylenchus destructor]|uniref:Serum response factor-binding protein 1 n=1 Tax=Ditylenchus destructor TaxID=166010 RepID=A0AAD4R8V4_9BILA|nr:serum response factor-binding protein 1 [Ditylenchus destructor]
MSELTAKELNNVITNLRPVIKAAKVHVTRNNIRQIQRYKGGKDEKKKKRIQRYEHEMQAIRPEIPSDQAALFKMVTHKSVTQAVDEVRKTYPNWHEEIPFLLQRFGLQAKERKKEKILSQISDEDKEDSDSQAENSEEDKPESKKEAKVVQSKNKISKVEKPKQRKNKIAVKPPTLPKKELIAPIDVIHRGESVIKRINLQDEKTISFGTAADNDDKGSSEDDESTDNESVDEEESEHESMNVGSSAKIPTPRKENINSKKKGFFIGRDVESEDSEDSEGSASDHVSASQKKKAIIQRKSERGPSNKGKPKVNPMVLKNKSDYKHKPHHSKFEKRAPRSDQQNYVPKEQGPKLHPSWIAKQEELRKRKEIMQAAPKGKHFKFVNDEE